MEDLTIKNLSFQYAGAQDYALKELHLTVKKGTILLLCGASGSGKSTLLKMLKPQIKPAGKLTGQCLLGQRVLEAYSESDTASTIGWVGQNPDTQFVTEKVWDELAFGLENLGLSTLEISNRIGELITFLNLTHLMDQSVSDLSGGEKQLVHLAAILVMRPSLLLLDEPTAQLDPQAAQQVMSLLLRINRELGITLIIAEHRFTGFFKEVDQVVLLDQGRVSLSGTPTIFVQTLVNDEHVSSHFLVELPTAVQLYAKSQRNQNRFGKVPFTVLEGKFFLETIINHAKQQVIVEHKQLPEKKQETAIQLTNGWFRYNRQANDCLEGVSLDVKKGEILTILGENGSGKTTLLKVLAGIQTCYAGKLSLFGKTIKKSTGQVAYLPQNPSLLFLRDTVIEDYQEEFRRTRYSKKEMQQKIDWLTEQLAVREFLDQHPLDLSMGQLQQVALGKLILREPDVFLLDEPTKGMDHFAIQQMTNHLQQLAAQGKTIICVSHHLDFAADISDRCCLFFNHQLFPPEASDIFFSRNQFYTTEASRIAKAWYPEVVTTAELIRLCSQLEEKK